MMVYPSALIMGVLKCLPVVGCFPSSNALIMGWALILGMPIPRIQRNFPSVFGAQLTFMNIPPPKQKGSSATPQEWEEIRPTYTCNIPHAFTQQPKNPLPLTPHDLHVFRLGMHLPRVLAWIKPLGRLGHSQNAGGTPLLPHPRPFFWLHFTTQGFTIHVIAFMLSFFASFQSRYKAQWT